jgi:hypothetical protein
MDKDNPLLEVEVRTIDLEGEGFFPKYLQIIRMKEAFVNPLDAKVDDVLAARDFLMDHMVTPSRRTAKEALINKLDPEQFMELFEKVAGGAQTAVPPASGEASEDTSE